MKAKPVTPQEAGLTPGLRRYVYFTAAFTGAAIMIVEILGAKMLSPYVGTSHYVWTAQIAVTLVALATGYYAGGVLADRSQNLGRLYWAILAAALYLAVTVLACEPVAYWCLDLKPFALGSLVASLALFFVPLGLMAMVGPFLVRVLTSAVANVGGTVGRLTAISTAGSFIGTMLIGYVLIPFLPNSWTMYATSLALMLVCAVYFFVFGRGRHATSTLVICLLAGISAGGLGVYARSGAQFGAAEKYRGNSNFGLLQVVETAGIRYYLNDYLWQNTYEPTTRQSTSLFTYMLSGLARVYTTNVHDVLCIGMGVGIAPMDFAREGARVDVVEINPDVVPLAERWFDLDRSKLNIIIADGRPYLNQCKRKYDVIALDAFLGEGSPGHLMSQEAFTAMRRVLKPGGTLVINSFATFEPGHDFFAASLYKTLTNVFPHVKIHTSGARKNTFYVAAEHSLAQFLREPDLSDIHPSVQLEAERAYAGVVEPSNVPLSANTLMPDNGLVLTDDYNPVEFYDVANRERMRRELARMALVMKAN